ncbi:TetR family transcriptional regulator [Sphingobium sp. GW456-12-10-14-TSB1]|nr:TetR family transcriptional regulator [Sphingobium sp. GW456-12-10-14-TSB1]
MAAATEEFASHGLAGARIDRIAQAAGISKPMLYTYFGDKEALFDAALTQEVMDAAQADRFDPNDLEGYAGRTYDLLVERPRLWRLLTWHHLERGQDVLMLPAGEVLLGEKLDGIAAAQAEGRIVADFTPMDVVRLVAALTQLWCMTGAARDATEHAARRATIMRAVGRLLRV